MRCPKCQYISFDRADRCRNCGYEFSFSAPEGEMDLPLKTGDEPLGPLSDLSLADVEGLQPRSAPEPSPEPPEPPRVARAGRHASPAGDLPLFRERAGTDDAPLVSLPAVPRAPVAVRRPPPAPRSVPARRTDVDEPALELEPSVETPRAAPVPPPAPRVELDAPVQRVAPAGRRLLAAAVDLLLLAAIDAAVLYLTLEVSGVEWAERAVLPIVPFVAFIALLNGGYLVAFTAAGGQSIGKMTAGIRVVSADPDGWTDRVALGQAVLRAVGYVAAALPAGLGFLPAFMGAERRGVHDRLAHTRVVQA